MRYSGCTVMDSYISSELYHRYWNRIDEAKKSSDHQLIQLDSAILFSKKPEWLLLRRALGNRVYSESYKEQIVLLAFKKRRREAIFYLSNWHKAEYVDEIKIALLAYLKETNFKNTGTTDYYKTVEELFKFKDPIIQKEIIKKLKKDRHWEKEEQRFKFLLADYNIYNIDNE